MCGSELQSLSYIEVHAYFKSLLFMLCGWVIHANYVQHVISSYNYSLIGSSVFWCCAVMCGLPYLSVSRIKDVLLVGRISFLFYFVFMCYAVRTYCYSLLLCVPKSFDSLLFLERGFIIISYMSYLLLNCYVYELLGLRFELRGLSVFLLFTLPLVIVSSTIGLASSVDFFYKTKRNYLRSYVFRFFLKSGQLSKDWFIFMSLILLYL